jgi:hypothetical protein
LPSTHAASETTARRKREGIALSFLVVMILWFNHEMILTGQIPFFRDLGLMFYPMRFSLAESFRSGELPLWDRYVGMGFPMMANFQSGAFYLPNVLLLLLPFFSAIRVIFLFHYLVAAIGAFVLCRRWRYPSYLAVVGALLFTLGGTIVSLSNLLNHFQAAVWLPWVLFFWERCLERPSWKNITVLTLVVLLQFLAGSPELYAMTMALVLLDGARCRALASRPSYSRALFLLLTVNILTIGLAMVQVLPTLELLQESRRAKFSLPFQLAASWSLRPSQLLNLFFLDREVVTDRLSGMEILFEPTLPFFVSYYMGAFALIGFCLWFYYSSWREKGVLLTFVIVSLMLAFGEYTPLYAVLFRNVPGMSLFRFPEKLFFLTYVALIFAVLRGTRAFIDHAPLTPRPPILIVSSICLVAVGLYVVLRIDAPLLGRFISKVTNAPLLSDSTFLKASLALFSMERQIALIVAIVALLVLRARNMIRVYLFKVLIVAVVFFDLYSAHESYQHLLNPSFIHENVKILPRPDPEPHRIFYYPGPLNLHPSHYVLLKKQSFAQFNSLAFSNLIPNTGIFYGFEYMQELDALIRWPYNTFLAVANKLPLEQLGILLGALNVNYLFSFQALMDGESIKLANHFEEYPSWLYRIERVVPRIYIVPKIRFEKDPIKTLTLLSSKDFDPFKEVILETALSAAEATGFEANLNIAKYTSTYVVVRASLNKSGILVLADSYYPGWKASVNGKDEIIRRANLFFRAVSLPPGNHTVEFRYEPMSFRIGLAVSIATLVVLLLVSVFVAFRQRQRVVTSPAS